MEVAPGLQPDGFGGVVALVDLVSPAVRQVIENPMQLLPGPETAAPHSLRAKVHASEYEWSLIVQYCVRQGIMKEIATRMYTGIRANLS